MKLKGEAVVDLVHPTVEWSSACRSFARLEALDAEARAATTSEARRKAEEGERAIWLSTRRDDPERIPMWVRLVNACLRRVGEALDGEERARAWAALSSRPWTERQVTEAVRSQAARFADPAAGREGFERLEGGDGILAFQRRDGRGSYWRRAAPGLDLWNPVPEDDERMLLDLGLIEPEELAPVQGPEDWPEPGDGAQMYGASSGPLVVRCACGWSGNTSEAVRQAPMEPLRCPGCGSGTGWAGGWAQADPTDCGEDATGVTVGGPGVPPVLPIRPELGGLPGGRSLVPSSVRELWGKAPIHDIARAIRVHQGRTQRELAETLGVRVQVVSKWEAGQGKALDRQQRMVVASWLGLDPHAWELPAPPDA